MMQRILNGEWFALRVYLDRDIHGGFGLCFYWRWRSYRNTHCPPQTPWDEYLLNGEGIPF